MFAILHALYFGAKEFRRWLVLVSLVSNPTDACYNGPHAEPS